MVRLSFIEINSWVKIDKMKPGNLTLNIWHYKLYFCCSNCFIRSTVGVFLPHWLWHATFLLLNISSTCIIDTSIIFDSSNSCCTVSLPNNHFQLGKILLWFITCGISVTYTLWLSIYFVSYHSKSTFKIVISPPTPTKQNVLSWCDMLLIWLFLCFTNRLWLNIYQ